MNHDTRNDDALTRHDLLRRLSYDEVASVCTAETKDRLAAGDEYLDLGRLHQGVQKAHGVSASRSPLLPRSAVAQGTWRKILAQLAKPPLECSEA